MPTLAREANLIQKSIVKVLPKVQTESSGTVIRSPVPANPPDAPPNLLCAVSICASPTAVTVLAYIN